MRGNASGGGQKASQSTLHGMTAFHAPKNLPYRSFDGFETSIAQSRAFRMITSL
jgi:hypothetical protein